MKLKRKAVLLSLAVLSVAAVLFLALWSGGAAPQISALLLGTTNGIVGVTNGSWTVYAVTNHTKNTFFYAGAKIELRVDHGWILDPALTPTEVGGWLVPPNRTWHDGNGVLTSGGSFLIFFNTPAHGARWRACLRFIRDRPSQVPQSLRTNTATWAALAADAMGILDRRGRYDCPVPEAFQ